MAVKGAAGRELPTCNWDNQGMENEEEMKPPNTDNSPYTHEKQFCKHISFWVFPRLLRPRAVLVLVVVVLVLVVVVEVEVMVVSVQLDGACRGRWFWMFAHQKARNRAFINTRNAQTDDMLPGHGPLQRSKCR